MNFEDELSSSAPSSISLLSSVSTFVGGAATRGTVRERVVLVLRVMEMEFGAVKNGNFVKEKRGKGFGGLVLGEESVSVVEKVEEECCSAINGEKKTFFFWGLRCC